MKTLILNEQQHTLVVDGLKALENEVRDVQLAMVRLGVYSPTISDKKVKEFLELKQSIFTQFESQP